MAGIKRKSTAEVSVPLEGQPKKMKKTTRASAPAVKPANAETKIKKEKLKKRKVQEEDEELEDVAEELVELDTSEDQNGFYGFSASGDGAELPDADEEEAGERKGKALSASEQYKARNKANGYKPSDGEGTREKKGDAANPTSSREAHAKQKELARERRAAKPHADSIQRAKKIWERLRIKSAVEPEERKKLVAELFDIITGRVKDFVFKHDSVRPIQCALKYASAEQRLQIAKELKGDYKSLAESKYAKFLIAKILVEGDDEIKALVITDFYGNVRRLINHPEAAWILDDAYRGAATPQQKTILLREWYGPDFALFRTQNQEGITADLKVILDGAPEKRKPVMDYLQKLINQLIQKKLTGFTMLHDAMLQYYLNLKPDSEELTEFFELLKGDEEGDLLKNLAFTKSGSQIVCHLLAHSDAKARRQILKFYKDTMEPLAYDKFGHHVLLTAYEVIDDTKMTAKAIFPELFGDGTNEADQQEKVLAMAVHLTGRKCLLSLLAHDAKWLYTPEDTALLAAVRTIRQTTSKKDPAKRREELIGYLAPTITSSISNRAQDFASNTFGCVFVTEALLSIPSPGAEVLSAVADLAKDDPSQKNHVAQSAATGRMLTSLVRGGRFNPREKKVELVEPPLGFADVLYERIKGHVLEWATGPSSFVVVALVESPEFSNKDEVLDLLRKKKKQVYGAAHMETEEQKEARLDREKVEKEGVDKNGEKVAAKKRKKVAGREVKPGNAGSRTLLEML